MSRTLLLAAAISLVLAACTGKETPMAESSPSATQATAPAGNPLLVASTLPYGAPAFDKIKDGDYQPAIEEGMKQHLVEIQAIADQADAPTFDNTLVAMEKSGVLLHNAMNVFGAVAGANTNDTLQKVEETIAPRLAEHQDAIYLNDKLFQRVQSLYDQRATLNLDPESARLLKVSYDRFVHSGAKLSEADKAKLKELNKEESTLSTQFTNRLLAATRAAALVVDDKARLAGLSDADIQAAAQAGKERNLEGKWVITLQNTTQQPELQTLTDRATREQLFKASWERAEHGDDNDTRELVSRLAQLRAERAKLLGFPSYAAWKLDDQMAKTPDAAEKFMERLVPAAVARATAEAKDIQAMIDREHAEQSQGGFTLSAADWNLYAEKVRKARYDLDESQIKPYFELDRVLNDGVFYAASQLYGLTFKERKDIPVYQPDVRVFEVFDKDGTSMALFYADFFKRDNKDGGAWMDNFVDQSTLLGTRPVIYNVANFTKPAEGQPALLSFDDVTTMFHEFGHALHGLFANQQYPSLSGTATAHDFVEFPSQFNEHWASDPKVFANYAKHYQSGEPMPQELVEKIKKAASFNQGYAMSELISAALLDMQWHMLPADAPEQDVDKFEAAALKKAGFTLPEVPPRYRSSYFQHIWGNDYAAGYYAYLWTQMLDADAFQWFVENGGLTPENGQIFRDKILSRGNTEDLAKLYRDFRGKEPSIEPMLKDRGLK